MQASLGYQVWWVFGGMSGWHFVSGGVALTLLNPSSTTATGTHLM